MKSFTLRPDTSTLNLNFISSGTVRYRWRRWGRPHYAPLNLNRSRRRVASRWLRRRGAGGGRGGSATVTRATRTAAPYAVRCVITYFSLYSVNVQCTSFAKLTFYNRPDTIYRDKGWTSWPDWLGNGKLVRAGPISYYTLSSTPFIHPL